MPLPLVNGFYEIRSVADFNTAEDEELTPCILMESFDCGGPNGDVIRQIQIPFELNLNGNKIGSVGRVKNEFGSSRKSLFENDSNVYNGEINFDYNSSAVLNFSPFKDIIHECRDLVLSGDIVNTATGGKVYAYADNINFNTYRIKNSINCTADNTFFFRSLFGNRIFSQSIFTGTLTGNPQLCEAFNGTLINVFYDSTKNPSVSPPSSGTTTIPLGVPKSTSDLKTLSTYIDKTNPYLGTKRSGTVSATAGGNTLTTTGTFSVNSAGEFIRVGDGANREVVEIQSIESSSSLTIVGTFASTHSGEVWYDFGRVPERDFTMSTITLYNGEEWAINDGGDYPILGYQAFELKIPSFQFFDKTGSPAVGATAHFFTIDPLDAKLPVLNSSTFVGLDYTTDANGVATYDEGRDGAVDTSKVYGAIALVGREGSTEMEVLIGAEIGRQNVDLTLPA